MKFLESVSDQLNLRWAWEKVRRAATPGDAWIDEIELAAFEVELESNLSQIAIEIGKGTYRMRPIRPMAFPKNPAKNGDQQVRQYFDVAVRDQVAWTAVVNIIGPILDPIMPAWSYGNRLFRSIWVDTEEDGISRRKIGRYRNSSGKIYLPFGQSWPIFRRHVYLSTAAMTAKVGDQSLSLFTEDDAEELSLQERLRAEHRCPFVRREYWNEREPAGGRENLFWCSIDFAKFYPSLNLDKIKSNIIESIPFDMKDEAQLLLDSMMRFKIDSVGWSKENLKKVGLKLHQQHFSSIPTGLYVAGFLANVGLLGVDTDVSKRLDKRDISHFRFVDDHIILAYSFEDLVSWVDEYLDILDHSNTGVKVNPEKIEPKELAEFFKSRKKSRKKLDSDSSSAKKACKLNPQFPTPLMTKTLSLVSAIARTDIDLLEESELISLTDQLEHMLLVDIPDTEIPEKTRLSFAAVKLMRLAESRLSNNSRLVSLECQKQLVDQKLENKDLSGDRRIIAENESKQIEAELRIQHLSIGREMSRALGLLRKVLHERPDRVRLWTRAIQMCRHTGVKGLKDILDEITQVESDNLLAGQYLMANTLALLGSEAATAARIVCDPEVADWRRNAAHSFLLDVFSLRFDKSVPSVGIWFLQKSWRQFCFGLFCADLIVRSSQPSDVFAKIEVPKDWLEVGKECLSKQGISSSPLSWAWWAVQPSLRKLSARADEWVIRIGELLPHTEASHPFWKFFPFDVPLEVLDRMRVDKSHMRNVAQMAGWWHDALGQKPEFTTSFITKVRNPDINRAIKNLTFTVNKRHVLLSEWCYETRRICETNTADPRVGEWTALEIVRQIARSIIDSEEFGIKYVSRIKNLVERPLCLHPANFRLPRSWLEIKSPRWNDWFALMRNSKPDIQIGVVQEEIRLADFRYTPVTSPENALFESINPVRGLGLLLYGLLKRDFELPAIWNGPGHSDVLNLLPRFLLRDMTCSSWTLGVLNACLQSRAMENIYFKIRTSMGHHLHDDSLHDPIRLLTAEHVHSAISKCQLVLEKNQLSTIDHRARQLTPISIRQLSLPEWAKAFGGIPEESNIDE